MVVVRVPVDSSHSRETLLPVSPRQKKAFKIQKIYRCAAQEGRTEGGWSSCLFALVVVFVCSAGLIFSQELNTSARKPLGLDELLSAMAQKDKERMAGLRDYSSGRRYTLENKKFGVSAEVRTRMTYLQPGTKTFEILSERGSKLIRERVLRRLIETELEAMRPEIRHDKHFYPAGQRQSRRSRKGIEQNHGGIQDRQRFDGGILAFRLRD